MAYHKYPGMEHGTELMMRINYAFCWLQLIDSLTEWVIVKLWKWERCPGPLIIEKTVISIRSNKMYCLRVYQF